MEATSKGCTDNGEEEAMTINCSEIRTGGALRPSAGMSPAGTDETKFWSHLQSVPAFGFCWARWFVCDALQNPH